MQQLNLSVGDRVTVIASPRPYQYPDVHRSDAILCGTGINGGGQFYHRIAKVKRIGKTFIEIPTLDGKGAIKFKRGDGRSVEFLHRCHIVPFDPSHQTIIDAYSPGFNILRHILVGDIWEETIAEMYELRRILRHDSG